MSHRIILINDFNAEFAAFKAVAVAVDDNWDNLSGDDQEAAETVFDDFAAWKTVPASYPGASAKIAQMKTELEPFQ